MNKTVLDKGFVRLVDHMGDDSRIVQSARVSYGDGTKSVRQDKGLIDYLVRHRHTSPLEQVEFTFHIKLPLFVMGQLVRHRTASLNQMSARYSVMKDEFYIPSEIRSQDELNKQGSNVGGIEEEEVVRSLFIANAEDAYTTYETLLGKGVAREMARMVLPQNLYTEVYWNQDLHNLLHLLKLRMDPHAQWEIQQYANAMYELIKDIVPWTIESWERHTRDSVNFTKEELTIYRTIVRMAVDRTVTGTYAELVDEVLEGYVKSKIFSKSRAREIREKLLLALD